jgi:hypothetical protein
VATLPNANNVPAEVYHLKAAGKDNWLKMDSAIRRFERARKEGLKITRYFYNIGPWYRKQRKIIVGASLCPW